MKKTLKILALVLAAAMVFSLFGCNSDDGTGETTTVPTTSGTTELQTSAFDPVVATDIKIGVLHITSITETSGYTYAHHQGILAMITALGLDADTQLVVEDEVDDSDVNATRSALDNLIAADCDIIFATSYKYMDTVKEYAEKNSDIIFSHCSGYESNDLNFNNYFGRIYEARYLSGIAAGLKAKELGVPLVGYVAAMDVDNSEVTGGINAFALGVQSVYEECEVKVKVTNAWYDPVAEGEAAKALIDAGCVVLAQHCDSDTVQTTAESEGVFGIGYNSDMTESAPGANLCSPIWNWGVYYTAAVQDVIDGTWVPENYFEGYNKGFVGLSPLNEDIIAEGTADAVKDAENKIKSGELFVFSGPLEDNAGNQIIGEGEKLTDAQITGGINYYLKGVSLL